MNTTNNKYDQKIHNGQFYTIENCFLLKPFRAFMAILRDYDALAYQSTWLEPFAGANNIVALMDKAFFKPATPENWACFDIAPLAQDNNKTEIAVTQGDSLANYPVGYQVAITNPPYLAKNSATRKNLSFPDSVHDDIYKIALETMLHNNNWVGAIIPESFITQQLFTNRLYAVISLNMQMFHDTEVPVCLALFMPPQIKQKLHMAPNNFVIYHNNEMVGEYLALSQKMPNPMFKNAWRFNDPQGEIGLNAIDNTIENSIKFTTGEEYNPADIVVTCRSFTRISGLPVHINRTQFIQTANDILGQYRHATQDVFMTCFKGLRKDNKYRRRLDWAGARLILDSALEQMDMRVAI